MVIVLVVVMLVLTMMMIITVVVMAVVGAALGGTRQLAVQIGGDERLYRSVRLSGPHLDVVLSENVECMLTNAADNNDSDSLFTQPTREQTGRVRWCRHDFGGKD